MMIDIYIYVYMYISTYLYIYLYNYLPTYLPTHLPTCLSTHSQAAVLKTGDECDPTILYNFHPDCTKFIMCLNGKAQDMSCPPGTRFNYAISACDMEANVPCMSG